MAKFRTKLVEIEAVQFTGNNWEDIWDFTGGTTEKFAYADDVAKGFENNEKIWACIYDDLHETWIGVKADQWIIRGPKGEYYPCDNETFFWKYEPVEEG